LAAAIPAPSAANTAVTFWPYAPESVAARSESPARIPAYSTTTDYIVRRARPSVNRSPDRAEERLGVFRCDGTRVRPRSGALGGLRGELRERVAGYAEVAQALVSA